MFTVIDPIWYAPEGIPMYAERSIVCSEIALTNSFCYQDEFSEQKQDPFS